ncbi:TetR family transcriptional regulator C-terminal domain-containing protein [Acidihalobacter yilgarnensis]|uniref:TetR family transcriptional regulator C-terminal domain-containing protein n=1 Tax=Acidihalobacter yilgarnensis TaxID=2819280 RepID=UPI0009F4F047|nr:TetR family transcriptional regulator C-terminal domain-containing protein [Acidihalobacter yilgarnensis]
MRGCLIGNLAAELGGASPDCRTRMAESVAEWRVRVALQISRAQWQGTVRRDRDAAVLAAYLWDV